MATTDELIAAVDSRHATARAELEALCSIPSISMEGFDPAEVHRSAEATAALLDRSGLQGVRLLTGGGALPAVYGEIGGHDDAPTLLLYAHHDVQPTGDVDAWSSAPFEPTERDGRLYGRGCADDKAGVVAHATALAAWHDVAGGPPINVKVIVEGEEEVGSPHLDAFLAAHGEQLTADAVVVADLVNWSVGVPSLTYLLRGLVDVTVEVSALDHAVHSGMYGGPVPDPLTALCKMIAGLTDDRGSVDLPALRRGLREPTDRERSQMEALDFDEHRFRVEAGLHAAVPLGGDPELTVVHKAWMEPNLTVVGIDAPPVAGAGNAIQPSARAKLSLRLGPGQDARTVLGAMVEHLAAEVPLGMQVRALPGAAGDPFETDLDRPAVAAMLTALGKGYGSDPVLMGCGGSIPFLGPLQRANPDAAMLLVGVEDPDSRAHGIDESLHLEDWKSACRSIALLMAELAPSAQSKTPL